MDEAHECGGGFFAAQGASSKALEFVEEAFDLMALFVEPPVEGRSTGAARIGLDLRGCATVTANARASRIRPAGGIGDAVAPAVQPGQRRRGPRASAIVARCGREGRTGVT